MTATRARLWAMLSLSAAEAAEFDCRLEDVIAVEIDSYTLANQRDAVQALTTIAQLEKALCRCQPQREHIDYSRPADYLHAADCPVTAALQATAP